MSCHNIQNQRLVFPRGKFVCPEIGLPDYDVFGQIRVFQFLQMRTNTIELAIPWQNIIVTVLVCREFHLRSTCLNAFRYC